MLPARTKEFVDALVQAIPIESSVEGLQDTDIVIVCGVRSPITKAGKGAFKDLKCDQLLSPVLQELLKRVPYLSADEIGDVVIGNCLQPGGGQAMARMSCFEASYPYSVPVASINRQCASGLQAIASSADSIKNGTNNTQFAVAGGVESMSSCSFLDATPNVDWNSVKTSTGASACMVPMGITSENVAKRYNITRLQMDNFALESHRKAKVAQNAGYFQAEIVRMYNVENDGGIRGNCTISALQALPAVFVKDPKKGTTSAGNSSQTSDGSAAVLITNERTRRKYKDKVTDMPMPILCLWRHYTVVGVPPEIMGIGPAYAIPSLLHKAGLTIDHIDVFEINEAFASQVLFCIQFLSLDINKVNPYGGAIAIGHPLGCTGIRLVITCANYLQKMKYRYGIISLCVGTGMGAAALIENPHYDKKLYQDKHSVSSSASTATAATAATAMTRSKL